MCNIEEIYNVVLRTFDASLKSQIQCSAEALCLTGWLLSDTLLLNSDDRVDGEERSYESWCKIFNCKYISI